MTKSDTDAGGPIRRLFSHELDERVEILIKHLLELEQGRLSSQGLETMMRIAHTLKGGARLSELKSVMELAHLMEDIFTRAQEKTFTLKSRHTDHLLQAVDTITVLAKAGTKSHDLDPQLIQRAIDIKINLEKILANTSVKEVPSVPQESLPLEEDNPCEQSHPPREHCSQGERVIRVNADKLNRIIGLTGELSVESKRLEKIRQKTLRHQRNARLLSATAGKCCAILDKYALSEADKRDFKDLLQQTRGLESILYANADALEAHERNANRITKKLFREAFDHRMRPFKEGTQGLHRLARNVAQKLGKQVQLDIQGENTRVDRDILEHLHVPLTHLLQNAIDHGIESPELRLQQGKPAIGTIQVNARHKGGMLSITVADDGGGIDRQALRQNIVGKNMATPDMAATMSDSELFDFLLLPDFTLKDDITTVSGRGVGMDIVRDMVHSVRGRIQIKSEQGAQTRIELLLPITLSVSHCIVVEIAGHTYALPVGLLKEVLRFDSNDIGSLENRQYITDTLGQQIALINAHQLLELPEYDYEQAPHIAVVLTKGSKTYALAVDRLIGETRLVERPVDKRLGQVQDVSAAAFLDDGTPLLILNVEDLFRSIERLVVTGNIQSLEYEIDANDNIQQSAKRVLVVDDSLTVRELERGLLVRHGYQVDVAIDGFDGWNMVRVNHYDLVISDIDMPRMNGIELVELIRKDVHLRELPIIVVSYKDRNQDKQKGLDAGADYYLTKGSFIDDSFIHAVRDLIGESNDNHREESTI